MESPPPQVASSVADAPLPRLLSIQALRGLAAGGVLLGHLFSVERQYSAAPILGRWSELGHAGVDLFFVISGFIMVYVTHAATHALPRGPGSVPGFLWRRASRIYPLYWIVSGAVLAVWLVAPDLVFRSRTEDPSLWKSFLLVPQYEFPLLAVGWTLIHEMYFYLVFAGFLLFARRWLPALLVGWAAVAVGAWVLLEPRVNEPVLRLVTNPLTLEFIAGASVGLWWVGGRRARRPALALGMLALAVAVLVAAFLAQGEFYLLLLDPVRRVAWFGSAALLVLAAALVSGWRAGAVSAWAGDVSYALYLTHVLSVVLLARLWPFWGAGAWGSVLFFALATAFALLVAHFTHAWLEQPLLKLARRVRLPARASAARLSG